MAADCFFLSCVQTPISYAAKLLKEHLPVLERKERNGYRNINFNTV